MYRDNKISLVIPAYNESRLIVPTVENTPEIVDKIYVVDDCSTDGMDKVVLDLAEKDKRVELIRHKENMGPGQGIITGYKASLENNFDIAVVVGGDNQMPLGEMERFLNPLIDGRADYTKGNRFMKGGNAFIHMPKIRLFGNTLISLMTKFSSGYYHIFDVVDGYTAINRTALEACEWHKAWGKYGYPMDFLMRLNLEGMRVMDIPRTAIYLEGERQSQIKGLRYALSVSPMLFRNFIYRLIYKYVFSNFHPIILLLGTGIFFGTLGLLFGGSIVYDKILHSAPPSAGFAVLCSMFFSVGIQCLFFAMLFDMQEGNPNR